MKKDRKEITLIFLKTAAFVLIFVLVYLKVEYVLEERTSNDKYAAFFEEKQDYQVLFLGNSHVTNGIYPMELYRDYGFTSYNFGGHANTMPTTYWIAQNALEYTSPELMVVDLRLVGSRKKHSDEVRYLHISLDCFPLNHVKVDAINDILEGDERNEFFWKMWIYHDRWDELDEKDFTGERKCEKGAESRSGISKKAKENTDYDRNLFLQEKTLGMEYLERLTKECREKGIQLLFIYMPVSIEDEDVPEINSAPQIAKDLGVDYIDFNQLHLVDYSIDYFDNNGHLNPSGARKVTDYLGQYIKEHYRLADVREDEAYASWKDDYEKYRQMKISSLRDEEDLDNFLMLLHDRNYSAEVTVYDESILGTNTETDADTSDTRTVRLLKNAGLYDSLTVATPDQVRSAREYAGDDVRVDIKVMDVATGDMVIERTF